MKNKSKELLERNPYGKVPVLEDGDAVIYESAVIDEYLEDKYPQIPLMPKAPYQRAQARIWIDYCNTRLQRAGGFISHEYKVEQSKAEVKEYLQTLDLQMANREYIAGDYSLADITFIPFFTRLERYQSSIGDDLPSVKSWMTRLLGRPAVRSTL
ncbi:MAG: glutathione S-transferase family protein [Deltaproteobacteria bacterium]|nr:glutathione S-transferase family protein [Deltaproteobacteria bacterium]